MRYTNIYANENTTSYNNSLRDYMYLIYKNMGLALLVSGVVAFIVGNSQALLSFFLGNVVMRFIIMLAPIFLSLSIGKSVMTSSVQDAKNKLYIFAALMGISLSTIFIVYTKQNIVETFLTTALTFGCMSLYGYTTKKDLTNLGSFLFMGVCGLLIASLINLFAKSSSINYMISCCGVIIFTLYTAYDVQKLKELHNYIGSSQDIKERIAVIGALELYLDFINIFTYLLSLMGRQENE